MSPDLEWFVQNYVYSLPQSVANSPRTLVKSTKDAFSIFSIVLNDFNSASLLFVPIPFKF